MITQIIIIGSGGHAQVVASEIIKSKKYELLGFIDKKVKRKKILKYKNINYSIIGQLNHLNKFNIKRVGFVCAIGNINLRYKIISDLNKKNSKLKWPNIISIHSNIDESTILGKGNMIIAGATVNVNCNIGNHNIINTNCTIDHNSKIGNFVNISPGSNIAGAVEIKDRSFIGMNSSIKEKIIIEKNVVVGANSFVNINCKQNKKYFGIPSKKIND